jgi:integrase
VPEAKKSGADPLHSAGVRRRAALRRKVPRRQPRDIPDSLLAKVTSELTCQRDQALVAVALGSGLRASELLSMSCGGIDAGSGIIRVLPKGGSTPIWVPATSESFVQISRYLISRNEFRLSDPHWVTRRAPVRPLTYFALPADSRTGECTPRNQRQDQLESHGGADRVVVAAGSRSIEHLSAAHDDAEVSARDRRG